MIENDNKIDTKIKAIIYRIQSTAKMRETFSVGRPRAVSTSSIVTNPALGILAAPMLAKVEVKLKKGAMAFF